MVYFFKSLCGKFDYYMGKDKFENEELIKYGLPEDVWFHVDDLSSAHVYVRMMNPGMNLDDLPESVILECASLVKANSIAGCKKASVYVIYTRWKNLKKTARMVEGQVGYHRPENVRRLEVEKNNSLVRQLEKTKREDFPNLAKLQQDRNAEIVREEKEQQKQEAKAKRIAEENAKLEKEALSYDRIMTTDQMKSNAEVAAEYEDAEAYEDDFF